MRLCKKCGAIMRYNEIDRQWECPACDYIISAITINGDRPEEVWQDIWN